MEINYLTYIALFLAGASNGIMDLLSFRFRSSVFDKKQFNRHYWNPSYSWSSKWKKGNPAYGERYLLSSTAFVFLTDAWHLFQWIMITFIALSVVFYTPQNNILITIIEFIALRFVFFQLGFWATFESTLLKK